MFLIGGVLLREKTRERKNGSGICQHNEIIYQVSVRARCRITSAHLVVCAFCGNIPSFHHLFPYLSFCFIDCRYGRAPQPRPQLPYSSQSAPACLQRARTEHHIIGRSLFAGCENGCQIGYRRLLLDVRGRLRPFVVHLISESSFEH